MKNDTVIQIWGSVWITSRSRETMLFRKNRFFMPKRTLCDDTNYISTCICTHYYSSKSPYKVQPVTTFDIFVDNSIDDAIFFRVRHVQ